MSNDPYPSGRPDPGADEPYAADPYLPGRPPAGQPPAYEPGRTPLPPPPGVPGAPVPGAPVPPNPYGYPVNQPTNVSAIILTVLSGLALASGYCCFIGIPGLVFGILGITKQASDPDEAARMTKFGWITFATMTVLTILGFAALIAFAVVMDS